MCFLQVGFVDLAGNETGGAVGQDFINSTLQTLKDQFRDAGKGEDIRFNSPLMRMLSPYLKYTAVPIFYPCVYEAPPPSLKGFEQGTVDHLELAQLATQVRFKPKAKK